MNLHFLNNALTDIHQLDKATRRRLEVRLNAILRQFTELDELMGFLTDNDYSLREKEAAGTLNKFFTQYDQAQLKALVDQLERIRQAEEKRAEESRPKRAWAETGVHDGKKYVLKQLIVHNDGGRAEAGYKGTTGDCGVRALAIAAQIPYQEAYDVVKEFAKKERKTKRVKRKGHSSPREGIWMPTMKKIMEHYGFRWVATKKPGQSETVHLRPDELPRGRMVLRLSKHYSAYINKVIHDTYDPSRQGTRMVYGYWIKDEQQNEKRA